MNMPSRSPFEQCILASGLLNEQQLDQARTGAPWPEDDPSGPGDRPTDGQLAGHLVEAGLLNVWQAKQLLAGRTKFNLGPYQIIDSIGQGGMGQVFKAKHEKIGRIVAVKVLPYDKSTPEAVAGFTHEIRALARLDHPRLVAALDAGQDGSVYYLVTEYVSGMDLRKLVRVGGPLGMPTAAAIICQVAEGLEYAHAQGLVHRDIKPGNVLVSPHWEVKISDLGLAGSLNASHKNDPRYGKIVGTADYLSPDQVRDPWNPTPAWDIYSLGCTLYYAVTGKVPFPGGTTNDKARAHCDLRPLDPRRLNPNLSSEFVDMMADMMAKEPSQRIASARDVITRLTPFLPDPNDLATSAFATLTPTRPTKFATTGAAPATNSGETMGPDFFGFPLSALDDDSSASEVLDPSQESDGRRSPTSPRDDLLAVLGPLTVFVLAPLLLLGAVWLLWWIARTFWF